ncbi:MAG: minichromosome maintenance protein MCM [Halobacteria archaeon]
MSEVESQELINQTKEFLTRYYRDEIRKLDIKDTNIVSISFQDLYSWDIEIADSFIEDPDYGFNLLKKALKKSLKNWGVETEPSQIEITVTNLPNTHSISSLRSNDINHYVAIDGILKNRTSIRPRIKNSTFECQRCGSLTQIKQTKDEFTEPHECSGCERKGPFEILYSQSEFTDRQEIKIQEPPEHADHGTETRNIKAIAEGQLADDIAKPGDRVTLTGILRAKPGKQNSATFTRYLEIKDIAVQDTEFEQIEITQQDLEQIEILSNTDIHQKLQKSIAPSIHGMKDEKLAVALQMFSGVSGELPDGERKRGEFHVAFVGDPGTGKSKLLQYAKNLAPRSIFTDGKGSSNAGLTATAVQSDMGEEEWTIKAGALVLADKGLACVDELDKMEEEEQSALNEALSNGTVSVAKAGKNPTLNARCSLLTALNPKHDRFDDYEPIVDQVDLPDYLMSRFDLIFLEMDELSEEKDRRISRHINKVNRAVQKSQKGGEITDSEMDPEIDPELFRKYVSYARRNIYPELTDETDEMVKDFYLELRHSGDPNNDDVVPVTARKQEAIIRLAEASARARLSPKIEPKDIELVKDLVLESLDQVGRDPETGEFDADIIESGTSQSQKERHVKIKNFAEEIGDKLGKFHVDDLREICREEGIDEDKFESTVQSMIRSGTLLDKQEEGVMQFID